MKSRVPAGLRVAFLTSGPSRPFFPLESAWADLRCFPVSSGWNLAATEAALFRPHVTYCVLDEHFDAASATSIPGLRVGLVTRPPHGSRGPWPLQAWREALDGLTWFEPPPEGEPDPLAVLPLPVNRARLPPPDFSRRGVVVPRWAAPSAEVMERLGRMEELVVLEPGGSLDAHLALLDTAAIFLTAGYDATGRLDPLPLQALARGLLVIATTGFPPLWGIEPEDDFLVRPEAKLLAAVDEVLRIPDTARAVRLRAFQKAAEFFDADDVFARLTVDVLLALDASRLVSSTEPSRLRRVR
ncbi:MAG: hypothetical protein SFW67_14765 [Myxococcaceae bacterium]|nr:hypothetical protein [Myxococcaceae bacterium]